MSKVPAVETVIVHQFKDLSIVARSEKESVPTLLQLMDDGRKEGHVRRIVQVDPDLAAVAVDRPGVVYWHWRLEILSRSILSAQRRITTANALAPWAKMILDSNATEWPEFQPPSSISRY
jgi:hypothetical protein